MSANVFGKNLTRYLGRGGVGKIMANAANVLQIANRCGGVAELAAGTYTIPTLESGQTMFWFWAQATGAVTITGAATLATNETALIIQNADGSWSAHVFAATGDDLFGLLAANAYTGAGFIPIPLTQWREVTSNDITNAAGNGGVLATDTTPTLEYVNGDTDSQIRMLWAATNVDAIATQITLPPDLDRTADIIINVRGIMSGAADSPTMQADTFFDQGDTKVEDDGGTVFGAAVATSAITIAAADIPDDAVTMSVELTPESHGTDTLAVYATWITYTRRFA
jgi:hypothetical protein